MEPVYRTNDFFSRYPARQINGCRYYGPLEEFKMYTPPQGSEVFIARIPHEFQHEELFQICSRVGRVYDLRLMITFMKANKGYAFVRYFSPSIAEKAIEYIHGYRLSRSGIYQGHLVATISTDHRTLMLTGCSAEVKKEEVELFFQDLEGAEVISVTEEFLRGQTSPIFYLLFASHRSAAVVRKCNIRQLAPSHWGNWVRLNWQPNDEVNQRIRFKLERRIFMNSSSYRKLIQNENQSIISKLIGAASTSSFGLHGMHTPTVEGTPSLDAATGSMMEHDDGQQREGVNKARESAQSLFSLSLFSDDRENYVDNLMLRPNNGIQQNNGFGSAQQASTSALNQISENRENLPGPSGYNGFGAAVTLEGNSLSSLMDQAQDLPRYSWTYAHLGPKPENHKIYPEGVWGGDTLQLQGDLPGRVRSLWMSAEKSANKSDTLLAPSPARGRRSFLQQDEPMEDEDSPLPAAMLDPPQWGRPIRGRGDDQGHKTMRF